MRTVIRFEIQLQELRATERIDEQKDDLEVLKPLQAENVTVW